MYVGKPFVCRDDNKLRSSSRVTEIRRAQKAVFDRKIKLLADTVEVSIMLALPLQMLLALLRSCLLCRTQGTARDCPGDPSIEDDTEVTPLIDWISDTR